MVFVTNDTGCTGTILLLSLEDDWKLQDKISLDFCIC